jgi:selenide,water dikinase
VRNPATILRRPTCGNATAAARIASGPPGSILPTRKRLDDQRCIALQRDTRVTPRTILLAGGGHAHVEVLRRFGARPEPGVSLVLVSPDRFTPYSGMLPGLVAGHYSHDQAHIDLEPLAERAGARFVRDRIAALDVDGRTASTASGERIAFDLVSLDVGSVPDMRFPGAREHSTGVKPVDAFLARWERVRSDASAGRVGRLAVVGGGAGGVEVLLAMHHRLSKDTPARVPRFVLVSDRTNLPGPANRALLAKLRAAGVELHLGHGAERFDAQGVTLAGGEHVTADVVFCATPATAAPWLAASGVACDDRGFVRIDDHLRSPSHPQVFAAGDCASQIGHVHPRSGVYAVRQGPPLAANLRAAATGTALATYVPQGRSLALVSTGGRHAVAVWGRWSVAGRWAWRWKDRIDRRFMKRYRVDERERAS